MVSEINQSEKDKSTLFHSYVESNEQTEVTKKMGTDSVIGSKTTAIGKGVWGRVIGQKREMTHRHGQQCGDCWRKEGIRE